MPTRPNIHFVTGKLAAAALEAQLQAIAPTVGFDYTVGVLPITVAALMTPEWINRKLDVPPETTNIIIPGYCGGDLTPLTERLKIPVECGPRDLHALPEFFQVAPKPRDYGKYDIEILAEINHAPRRTLAEILTTAQQMKADGADLIDVGCQPGETWKDLASCVNALIDEGFRVSVDSMNVTEIAAATSAGAELVLSVNSQNRHAAVDWGCEVVVVPDDPATLAGFDETIEFLRDHQVPFRIDPILEPIGFGFAKSLYRYFSTREKYPDCEIMMGVGNLTELTECDSSGVNMILLALCQELGIRSVLTTEVINWARSSVKECSIARRLAHFAVTHQSLPKHIDSSLAMLRDPRLYEQGAISLETMATEIRDNNFRLFAEQGEIHALSRSLHESDADAFLLFEKLLDNRPANLDASHAFYLGYEMAKATIALQLGKQYRQDESLRWGLLTVEEASHRLRKTAAARKAAGEAPKKGSGLFFKKRDLTP